MTFRVAGLAFALACCAALAVAQQPLRLQIAAGRVTLHAQNVPVRMVLAEWARVGGAKIINAERITSPPVTLDLENVPERQALDILLRGVSGYMVAARAAGTLGASMYDRIMILPTSAAPPAAAAPVVNGRGGVVRPGVIQRAPPGVVAGADGDDSADDNNDGVPLGRPAVIPRPIGAGGVPIAPPVIPGAPIIPGTPVTPDSGKPPAPPAVVATPANPFGLPVGSSARPGVVTPTPQQAQPQPRNAQD